MGAPRCDFCMISMHYVIDETKIDFICERETIMGYVPCLNVTSSGERRSIALQCI